MEPPIPLSRRFVEHIDILIALLCYSVIVISFWPGFMSPDTVYQLKMAVSGEYTNVHPPIFSWVWRMLNHLAFGPASMFVFQNLAFAAGVLFLVRAGGFRIVGRCTLIVLIYGFPPVYTLLGPIWKDVHMAIFLFFAASITFWASRHPHPERTMPWALVALAYGTAVRHNALFALPPLAATIAVVALRKPLGSRGVVLTATLLALACWGTGAAINRHLYDFRRVHLKQRIQLHDLAGMAAYQNDTSEIREWLLKPEPRVDVLRKWTYAPDYTWVGYQFFLPSDDRESARRLTKAWLEQIARHPRAYLFHRWSAFRPLLGIGIPESFQTFFPIIIPNPWNFTRSENDGSRVLSRVHAISRRMVIFRGYFYLLALLILLGVAVKRGNALAGLVAASGLLYIAGWFFVALGWDFRFFYWPILATIVVGVMLIADSQEREAGKAP